MAFCCPLLPLPCVHLHCLSPLSSTAAVDSPLLQSSAPPSWTRQRCATPCHTPPAPLLSFVFWWDAHIADCCFLPPPLAASSCHCWLIRHHRSLSLAANRIPRLRCCPNKQQGDEGNFPSPSQLFPCLATSVMPSSSPSI